MSPKARAKALGAASTEALADARRLIACGLPVPTFTPGEGGGCAEWQTAPATPAIPRPSTWEVELAIGDTCRPFGSTSSAGLLFRCVETDNGPELLPVLDDFALLGWVITELERIDGPVDIIYHSVDTRIEALVEALVAALEAAK